MIGLSGLGWCCSRCCLGCWECGVPCGPKGAAWVLCVLFRPRCRASKLNPNMLSGAQWGLCCLCLCTCTTELKLSAAILARCQTLLNSSAQSFAWSQQDRTRPDIKCSTSFWYLPVVLSCYEKVLCMLLLQPTKVTKTEPESQPSLHWRYDE